MAKKYQGTIRYVDLEGGAWMLETAEKRYPLKSLAKEYRKDGLVVEIEGEEEAGFGFLMAGNMLSIVSIRKV
ncbi:MAG: hypothetical protein K6A35_05890 [bacterium]|nr:hypothetical protein [bacterium]